MHDSGSLVWAIGDAINKARSRDGAVGFRRGGRLCKEEDNASFGT